MRGARQLHVPPTQATPVGQTLPHVPQLPELVARSTQALPHFVRPGGHPQVPPVQTSPGSQVRPHPPQSVALVCGSTHPSPQARWGRAQVQSPAMHVSPLAHVVPHAPQLASSMARSVHVPLHTWPSQVWTPQTGAPPASQEHVPRLHDATRRVRQRARALRLRGPHVALIAALQRRALHAFEAATAVCVGTTLATSRASRTARARRTVSRSCKVEAAATCGTACRCIGSARTARGRPDGPSGRRRATSHDRAASPDVRGLWGRPAGRRLALVPEQHRVAGFRLALPAVSRSEYRARAARRPRLGETHPRAARRDGGGGVLGLLIHSIVGS